MVQLSLNEIYSETQKALRSLGIDWGIAKDCAVLTRWLALHNQYFLGSILKTADMYKNKKVSISIQENNFKKPLSANLMGMLLVEYIAAKKIVWEGFLYNPKFILAAMNIIAIEQKINMELRDKNNKVIAFTNNKKLYADIIQLKTSNGYFFLSLEINNKINKLDKFVTPSAQNTSYVNEKCWNKLKAMAFETYVPESETSISGAGY
jgi:hypothetical protein